MRCFFVFLFLVSVAEAKRVADYSPAEQVRIREMAEVKPSARQLAWQQLEMTSFFHFGLNTFTGKEWGSGKEDPRLFNPADLDCDQWIRAVKASGSKLAIFTAKHHDGFCLWPSRYTDYSVASSPWKGGKGDVMREFVDACRRHGLKVGVYLSPWDRHEKTYGSAAYNAHFLNQIAELCENYGPFDEFWFDGACGEGPNGKKQVYDWLAYYALIRTYNPATVIAVSGPDVRWVGNESGYARESEWSVVPVRANANQAVQEEFADYHFEGVDPAAMAAMQLMKPVGDQTSKSLGSLAEMLVAERWGWYPAECDVSIRPGWFYHPEQDKQVKSLEKLADLYFKSIGRNSVLLLNVPPDRTGRVHAADEARLREFGEWQRAVFTENLATGAQVKGRTEWRWASPVLFDVIEVSEDVTRGQRVEAFRVEALEADGSWKTIARATTIGYKRLIRLNEAVSARGVRLIIEDSRAEPFILGLGLYRQPKK